MNLDLRFTSRPPDTIWCEAVVVFLFRESLDREYVPGVDRKTSAYLRALCKRGFWSAARGDVLLLAGEDRLRAEKVVLIGLGKEAETSIDELNEQINRASITLDSIDISNMAVRITLPANISDPFEYAELSCKNFLRYFLDKYKDDDLKALKVIFSMDWALLDRLEGFDNILREYIGQMATSSIVMEKKKTYY